LGHVTSPTGWYLKPLAKKLAALDQVDYVEDLCIAGGKTLQVMNAIALHGGLVGSWPMMRMTSENTVRKLIEFWSEFGLPDYAQFDNATGFSRKPMAGFARKSNAMLFEFGRDSGVCPTEGNGLSSID
jgi:hypothetical protein